MTRVGWNSPDTGPVTGKVAGWVLCLLLAGSPVIAGAEVQLQSDTEVATAGYYQLSWAQTVPGMRLVESADAGFDDKDVIYKGADTARLVSGKPDGNYYYRLEAEDGITPLSNTLLVTVQHHSLRRAWAFFAIGAAVFVATLGLIVFGSRSAVGGGR